MGRNNLMNEQDIIKVFSYIATSARGCIDEPKIYGPFRLVETISKLFWLLKSNNLIANDKLSRIIDKIDEKKYVCVKDEKKFISLIDKVIDDLFELVD